jgi:large subunit ribosomal protein L35e
LADLKKELLNLKVQKTASGAANKIAQIRLVRKAISRVLTILSENQKQHVLKLYENKKLNKLPKDLRPKLTRAMRRRLSPREAGKRTLRQIKKDAHFSNVKFAVLA